jgi:hypothetical protein
VESLENQKQVSQASHRSLEISQKRRDSHISTAPTNCLCRNPGPPTQKNCGLWESGNPKAGFPLSHSPDSLRRKEEDLLKKSSDRAERTNSHRWRPPSGSVSSCVGTKPDFSIILGLENANGSVVRLEEQKNSKNKRNGVAGAVGVVWLNSAILNKHRFV